MDQYEVLKKYFGYTSFREGQELLIRAILDGLDVLGIMPTGGGKSLCYQIPALLMDGITLVISPLISLMKDQVLALNNAGIAAAYLNSSLTSDQAVKVLARMRQGAYKIIYVAPERLTFDGFVSLAQGLNVSMVAVDEAHCISQWGNDFRPSYLKIAEFVAQLPRRPIVTAFTATATERVRNDIRQHLGLRTPVRVVTGFDRPNLRFSVERPQKRAGALLSFVQERKEKSGIVYCMTRNTVEKVCDLLVRNGFAATRYHAGLDIEERTRNQEDFVYDRKPIIVATNAFGMGIDKSNVSYVVHYNMPLSLEAYYQEAGRAGRDGEPAECVLMFQPSDIEVAKMLIESRDENPGLSQEEQEQALWRDRQRLNRMLDYCRTTACLRGVILDYFGQEHEARCENCGNCSAIFLERDITVESQKILSCVKRIKDRLGYCVGAGLLSAVLRGGNDERVERLGLREISTYGVLSDRSVRELTDLINALLEQELLLREDEHSTLQWTDASREVVFDGRQVVMHYRKEPVRAEKGTKKRPSKAEQQTGKDAGLYEVLRALRFQIAAAQRVPAYIVFSNATLVDMARKRPRTVEEFYGVSGVGKQKAKLYAEAFVARINEYCKQEEARP